MTLEALWIGKTFTDSGVYFFLSQFSHRAENRGFYKCFFNIKQLKRIFLKSERRNIGFHLL